MTLTRLLRAAVYFWPSTLTSTRQVYFPESSGKGAGNLRRPLSYTCRPGLRGAHSCTQKHSGSGLQPAATSQLPPQVGFTFIQRTVPAPASPRTSSCLQGKPLLMPRCRGTVSEDAGQVPTETSSRSVSRAPSLNTQAPLTKPPQLKRCVRKQLGGKVLEPFENVTQSLSTLFFGVRLCFKRLETQLRLPLCECSRSQSQVAPLRRASVRSPHVETVLVLRTSSGRCRIGCGTPGRAGTTASRP